MRAGSGGNGGVSFKACDACRDVFNKIFSRAKSFGGSRFGWSRARAVPLCTVNSGDGGWAWKKGGKDVVAVVKSRREGGILDPGRDEGWRGRWRWWKEANQLEGFGVRSGTGDAIVFGDSLVECGGDIEEPGGAKLGRAGPLAFTNAAGEEGKVFKEGMKVFA